MYLTTRMKAFKAGPKKYLVCNGMTGEIVVMTETGVRLLEMVRNGNAASCASGMLDELKRRQFLFASKEDEEAAFLELCRSSWKAFLLNTSRHYTFIVNTHCNLSCPYCFEREELRARANTLSREQVDAAFRIIDRHAAKHAKDGAPDFEIFGGEPLLPGSRELLDFLLDRIAERHYAASVQTNGYFLSSFIDFFARHQEHIRLIQVTLDGPKAIHDRRRVQKGGGPTFDRIVSGIQALRREDLPIRITLRMNVDRENLDYLEDMAEVYSTEGWADDSRITFIAAPVDNRCGTIRNTASLIGWRDLFERVFPLSRDMGSGPFDLSVFKIVSYFRYYFDTVRRPDHTQPLFIPKVLYCEAAALKLLAFHPDGRIYPCPETVGREQMAIGTYYPKFAIDRSKARQWNHQTILKKERCRACEISTFCGGGCVLTALLQNGSMSLPVCEDAPDVLESYFGQIY